MPAMDAAKYRRQHRVNHLCPLSTYHFAHASPSSFPTIFPSLRGAHATFAPFFSTELGQGDTWSAGDVNKLLAALRSWMEMGEITRGVISMTGAGHSLKVTRLQTPPSRPPSCQLRFFSFRHRPPGAALLLTRNQLTRGQLTRKQHPRGERRTEAVNS